MVTYIVTQRAVPHAIVKRLVRDHPVLRRRSVHVFDDEGGGPTSLARTILSSWREPVALVLDTKTIDPGFIAERRGFAEWHVGAAGSREDWEIVQCIPEVEMLLFQDEEILHKILPAPLSFEQRIVARYEPKRILSEIFTQAGKPFPRALIQRISRTNLSALWKLPVLQPLERFLLGGSQPQHPGNPA